MAGIEDEGLEVESDDVGLIDSLGEHDGDDAPLRERAGPSTPTYQTQAIRNLQRARKALTSEGGATGLSDYLMQSATIWAILELADAVRTGRQL